MNDSENDDDFLPAAQVSHYGAHGWSQMSQYPRTSSSQRSRNPGTSSSQQNQGGSATQSRSQGASMSQGSQNHRASTSQSSQNQASSSQEPRNPGVSSQGPQNGADRQQQEVYDLKQLVNSLRLQVEGFTRSDPGTVKSEEQKKKQKEGLKCQICHRVLANKTNLFRHYKSIHNEFHPDERFGYSVNETVFRLDDSLTQQHRCGICGYETTNTNSMDAHAYTVHSNDVDKCKVCGYKASSKDDLDNHVKIHVNNNNGSVNNSNVVEAAKDEMHKCEECDCYFVDKRKFDEHMKVMHGFEVLCKICNKNFRFKDFENHVRDSHPDVYREKQGNLIAEKNVRTNTGRGVVFKCNKCNEKFGSKKEAWRHSRIHKKAFRSRAVSDRQANNQNCDANKNYADVQTEIDIIFICEVCNIATASYDVVVEHSQKHIVNPDVQFATNVCDTCELKFEPMCYEKHIDVHYKNRDTNKNSFKYLKYKYHLLLTSDWFNFFNTEKEVVDRIVSGSIYAETRSIRMRVVSGNQSFTNILYECRQCDNFVEPSTVAHHALNFDTCVRIRTNFLCNVCEKSFNTEVARDNHEAIHTGDESFRIVMFNNERDREFNHKLYNSEPGVISQAAAINDEGNNAIEKVIYKCLCGLCFVFEDSANNHVKICPGNDQKQVCQKCNNLFNLHELVDHCYQHHLIENIRLITMDIVPDVIVVPDSDDEAQAVEILSSDDEDENDKAKQSQNDDVTVGNKENVPQTIDTENVVQNNVPNEESDIQTDVLVVDNAKDVHMDEGNEIRDDGDDDEHNEPPSAENSDHSNFEVNSDEDSQNTIIFGGNYTTPNMGNVKSEIKCVETNLLINPVYVRNRYTKSVYADDRNNNSALKTEITRPKTEAPEVHIKEEIPWYIDEDTDMDRTLVRQTSNVTSSDTVIIDLGDILTDDEDEVMSPVNEHTDAHVNSNNVTVINVNPEEMIEDSDTTVVYNLQNVQNDMVSYTNMTSDLIEEIDVHNDETMDIFSLSDIVNNAKSKEVAILSEKQTVVNTDNIKIKDETRMRTIFITRSGQNENDFQNTEIEEITSNDTLMPFRNRANDTESVIFGNNLEIQVSGQPNCNIV